MNDYHFGLFFGHVFEKFLSTFCQIYRGRAQNIFRMAMVHDDRSKKFLPGKNLFLTGQKYWEKSYCNYWQSLSGLSLSGGGWENTVETRYFELGYFEFPTISNSSFFPYTLNQPRYFELVKNRVRT